MLSINIFKTESTKLIEFVLSSIYHNKLLLPLLTPLFTPASKGLLINNFLVHDDH